MIKAVRCALVLMVLGFSLAASAIEGYRLCGNCRYFDPSDRSCREAPDCWTGSFYYDCGHCAAWHQASEGGYCLTVVGCAGATRRDWPQVLWGHNQSVVSDAHTVIHNGRGSSSPGGYDCYQHNRDGRTCDSVGYEEGLTAVSQKSS